MYIYGTSTILAMSETIISKSEHDKVCLEGPGIIFF
jgi:hypothetical protein